MTIVWLATAERDLEALETYIAEESPKSALSVSRTIRQSVEQLAIVVYILTAQYVQIVALVHTAQKWPDGFSAKV